MLLTVATGLNENPCDRNGIPPYELLVKKASEAPKVIKAITIALGCPSDCFVRFTFLKATHCRTQKPK